MSLMANQVAVPKTTAGAVAQVPPGPCTVVLSNTSGVTVWIGFGANTTTTNGFSIPSGTHPVTFNGYEGSQAASLYAIGTSTAASLGILVSSTH